MREGRRSFLKPVLAVAALALVAMIAMIAMTAMTATLAGTRAERERSAYRGLQSPRAADPRGDFPPEPQGIARALVVTVDNLVSRREPFTPLDCAARSGQVKEIAALLDAGAAIDELDHGPNGWTALMHAVHKDQEAAVDLLLARGANPDAVAAAGSTALDLAAGQGELGIVRRLLAAGAVPTPLALTNAVADGHTAVIRALLERSPHLRLRPGFLGRLSLLLARLHGDRETLTLLAQAAASRP